MKSGESSRRDPESGSLKKLAEENFQDDEVKELLDNFVLVIVDGDTDETGTIALGATQGYPHLIFLAIDGTKVAECLGYKPVDEFKKIVEDAVEKSSGT